LVDAVVALSLMGAMALAQPGLAKETVPITGELTPERTGAAVGATVSLRLVLTTTVAFPQVAVRLKVPDGTTLVEGSPETVIVDFAPGTQPAFDYRIRVDTDGEKKVWAEAAVLGLGDAVLRRLFLSVVNPADADTSPPTLSRDRQRHSGRVQGIPSEQAP
jgi:hypothetical protein